MNKSASTIEPAGDGARFHQNWRSQQEAHYLHWTRDDPANQIQLAFRRHWQTFQPFLEQLQGRRCLEVGCGRGSLSAYFADAGWDCTLLDISPKANELARKAFIRHGLQAVFNTGDCLALPYRDRSFDVCFSIGLLEHFREFDRVIREQVRVLKPGGLFLGYIVPHIPDNVQHEYNWICDLLKTMVPERGSVAKTPVYRSDALSAPYLQSMADAGLVNRFHSGIYPLPMISHSIEFPFTLLPDTAEAVLVKQFNRMLNERRMKSGGKDPWLCDEREGQAILTCGYKAES